MTNNVYVLAPDLSVAGRLEGLAKGEQIYSARFLGDRLYLVTFERTDPLFHDRPVRSGRAESARRTEDPGLLELSPSLRRQTVDRHRQGYGR